MGVAADSSKPPTEPRIPANISVLKHSARVDSSRSVLFWLPMWPGVLILSWSRKTIAIRSGTICDTREDRAGRSFAHDDRHD